MHPIEDEPEDGDDGGSADQRRVGLAKNQKDAFAKMALNVIQKEIDKQPAHAINRD